MNSDIERHIQERTPRSREAFELARQFIPGGVASAARFAMPYPIYIARGDGGRVIDLDGNQYVDCRLGFGPILLGHSRKDVRSAIEGVLERGFQFGSGNEFEIALAQKLVETVPCAEKVAFCSSGTEATMHALRIARAYTGRSGIAKFEGGYHGGHDYVLSNVSYDPERSGESEHPQRVPEGLGIPADTLQNTVILPYNHPSALEIIKEESPRLAAVIIEVVQGNTGSIPADKVFLQQLRNLTQEKGVLLIFDEIITGFRLALGGGQEYFRISPDMATFGKAIGGGFPIGAITGRTDVMNVIEYVEDRSKFRKERCFYAGTYNGNPMSTAAGSAVIDYLRGHRELYGTLNQRGEKIRSEVEAFAREHYIDVVMTGAGSIFSAHFLKPPVSSVRDLNRDNKVAFWKLYLYLLKHGVFTHPNHGFLCFDHTEEDINVIIQAYKNSLLEMRNREII